MKSIIYKLLLIVLSLNIILLNSCKKDEPTGGPTSVHGFVISDADGRKVAGADVWLVTNNGTSALSDKVIAYKKASNDGYYNFDFDAAENGRYFLVTEATHYYKKEFTNFTKGKNNKLDLPIWPKGYVALTFIDEPPTNFLNNFSTNGFNNLPSAIQGDTVFYRYEKGNTTLSFTYSYKPSGSDFKRVDTSINLKALDTVDFIIRY